MDKNFEMEYSTWTKRDGTIEITAKNNEEALYELSRALKFKARSLRAARIQREELAEKERQRKFVEDAKSQKIKDDEAYKLDLDRRIRAALLSFAEVLKLNGLAVDAPNQYSWTGDTTKHAVTLVDVSRSDPARSGKIYKISAKYNGFQWD